CRVKLPIAAEERILQFSGTEIRVPPCGRGGVVSIQILLGNPASGKELIILLSSRNWSEYIERSNVRIDAAQDAKVFANAGRRVAGKTDDIGKMADDAVFTAEPDDVSVCGRMILSLM